MARRAAAGRRGGGRSRRPAPLYPRAVALLHDQTAARAETYVPAGRGQAATRSRRAVGRPVTTIATAGAVVVSAKGAARWQAGHPWIYRSDIHDEPADRPGLVMVTDRRGRHLGQALYS